jgi:UrcA family protein
MSRLHRIHLSVISLLAISALPVAESAMAAARIDDAPSVTVRYHDLNLDSAEGVASLYGRIHAAALEVCKPVEGPQLLDRVFWNDCVAHAVANAVRTVHNEKLSAYHWERIRGWRFR